MPIALTCTKCNGKLRVADHLAGKKIKCPKCSALLSVPASEQAAITKEKPPAKSEAVAQTVTSLEEVEDEEDEEEEEEERRPRKTKRNIRRDATGEAVSTIIPYKNGRALAAYYLGVFSLIPGAGSCFVLFTLLLWRYYLAFFPVIPCAGLLFGPIALVMGFLGLRYVQAHPTAKGTGHALAGIILGGLTTVGSLIVLILLFTLGKSANFK